ncbi:(+)-neomenthol dehydrogenase-like isoform X2 [Alnus glutinosa]|uniref:(+)-neomenthol dehydrogenase-like isoform X2 n=1 Tax=Alnus glutinosa TaxID=3517 RepID=UPI002D76FECE|nr:(+)-neomenthol dehydrogenase-like isoform X2 [Alnus glutinosa]
MTKRIAVVTGANKGIGFEICKQLASNGVKVILTARDEKRGNEAVEKLKSAGYSDVIFHQLDVVDNASISSFANFIKTQFGKLDILINNAAIAAAIINPEDQEVLYDKRISNENTRKELEDDVDDLTEEKVDKVVEGFLEDTKENLLKVKGWPANYSDYSVSKVALNAYTRVLAKKYLNIAINAVSPGFVKTDLTRNTGVLTVEEGAKGPVMLALMSEGGPSGLFFDRTKVSTF